jgi:adenosylcobinamide-GDP ribazoletransferase
MRQALALLTVLPSGSADAPDRSVMLYAPAAGVLLGAVSAGALAVTAWAAGTLPAATVAVAVLALLTRGLHLDGLADLADGLGSGKPAEQALEIMRRSDIGPMGVVTIVLALLIQVAALARATSISRWHGAAAVLAAVLAGRLAMTWACRDGVPAARPGGLGAMVAGTVRPAAAGLLTVIPLAGACLAASLAPGFWAVPPSIGAGLAAAWLVRWHAVRRLGGVTGDVLGALCEVATTVTLLVAAMDLHA